MTHNPRGFLFSIIFIGVAAFMMACGGDDSGGGGSDPLAPGGSGSNAGAGVDADLRLVGGDPITLDPALAGDAGSATYIVELFGGLLTIDKSLQIVPDLAEAMPQVTTNGDGTQTYTFKIRRDAQFHDGRPVTAEDVRYSLNRTAQLGQTTSATADAYLGDIVGARDVTRGRAQEISGVKVVDSSTVSITIDSPKAYFLAKLTYPTAFVVDKQQVEANPRNWTRKPNGTGPFKMVEWRLNERIILEANTRYHLGAPTIGRVLFLLAGGSTLTQYENDELDMAGISTLDIERVQSPRDPLNAEYKNGPDLSISYIGFNTKTPPFDDPKVRQAFAMAIDREQIVRVVLKNMVPVATGIMMPGLPGHNPNSQTLPFDPARAKQLLAESKYGSAAGLGSVTITEIGGGANAGVATQAILEMWRNNLGVEVSIAQSEAASFFDDLDRGRLQMFDIGWIMDYPDPEDIIDLLFHSTSRQNNTGYSNPQVDSLVVQARTEPDQTKRMQLYQEAERIIIQDAPWAPLFFGRTHLVVKPNVKGLEPLPIVIPHLRQVTVD
nr:extracellular solute-binding protein [uncultured bacterium]